MPVFIQDADTDWTASYSPMTPQDTSTFDALNGDVLVAAGVNSNNDGTTGLSVTNNGTALTWTLRQCVTVAGYARVSLWTTILTTDRPGLIATFTPAGNDLPFGGNVMTFRYASGVGASNKTNVVAGAPSLSLTTTGANSSVIVVNSDRVMSFGERVWRLGAGVLTDVTFIYDGAHSLSVYLGCHVDAGAAGAKTVGLTDPTNQQYSIAAVEVLEGTPPADGVPALLYTVGV
jgi:hypothetical protein